MIPGSVTYKLDSSLNPLKAQFPHLQSGASDSYLTGFMDYRR